MIEQYKKLQEAVVVSVIQSIPEEWERVVINYEMMYTEEGHEENRLGFYIVKDDSGTLAKQRLGFAPPEIKALRLLNEGSIDINREHWGICELVIDRNGKYTMTFSFERPKRINGIHDEESYYRFGKYLETYKPSLE